ncbi:MAG: glycine cleavage system aminomethyltransferase GcvT [Pseudomonadota bacterium]
MSLLHTPLDRLHRELGARMVPFAGYEMPVQYAPGIIKEHLHTRHAAGLFDVSHMGQLEVSGPGSEAALESLLPVDLARLQDHSLSYALLTNERGGVRDDLIVTRWGPEHFFLVVNAACKEQDIAYLRSGLNGPSLTVLADQALLALQGPLARDVMAQLCPSAAELKFMQGLRSEIAACSAYITCSGYTGEDGFEISVSAAYAEKVARLLLADERVAPIGLGARDSLRLEAGLCLYGHELTEDTNLVESGLYWSVSPARRPAGDRPGGFPGSEQVFLQSENKPPRRRIGLRAVGKRPLREGQTLVDADGRSVGHICSACYGASLGKPIAMAYVERELGDPGTELAVLVRDKTEAVVVTPMPFVPQRYVRG